MKLLVIALVACSSKDPEEEVTKTPEVTRTPEEVFQDLVVESLHARTAAELVPGAPARALVIASSFRLPYGDTTVHVVGLAPGEPGTLPVPTQLELLRFSISGARTQRAFTREDLVTATQRALADEGKALAAAEAALIAAHVERPRATWKAALRSATYDARLPARDVVGSPAWIFVFEPWDDKRGWNQVVLDANLGVTLVNGKRP